MNLPTKLSDIIMQNKTEILALLDHYMNTNNMNLLFIGSNNTFKSKIITLLVEEYYNKKRINYKNLVMNIDCFMDITFSNSINEIKTFCKTNTLHPKIIVIDNFDIINESNQQYLKKWMDNCKNTFFIFGCENTNKINEIIQTRITPIFIEDLNIDNYRELIETISKKENIIIDNIDDLLKYKNMSIYFIYNLFYKLKLLKKTHIVDIIPYITLIDYTLFDNYFHLLKKNDNLKKSIEILFGLYDKGYSLIDIYHFMYEYIKVTNHPNKYTIIEKLCSYIQYIYDGFDNKIMLMFFTNDIYNIQ
jgi:hypothetical protein